MDREQEEMRSLGLFGVYKETYMLISSWKKIFNQITSALIYPLGCIFLVNADVSGFILSKIIHNVVKITKIHQHTPQYQKLYDLLKLELIALLIFKLVFFISFAIVSLLSTSSIVYTVFSIYTSRKPTFLKVMGVFPRVRKRLLVTFLCGCASLFAYTALGALFYLIWILTLGSRNDRFAICWVIVILYFVGVLYLGVIWNLASVMSVLEDSYGFQAMIKSMKLIKGKLRLAMIISLKFSFLHALVDIMYLKFVVHGCSLGLAYKVTYGILFSLVLSMLFLFELVIKTVIYFVCKSNHHENIDKLTISDDHLQPDVDEDAPLKGKDAQFQQYDMA